MPPAPRLLLASALAGTAALAAETLWIRILGRATSAAAEALAAVAAVFLAGLAAGAGLGGRAAARSPRPAQRAALAALAAGTWIAASPWLMGVAGALHDALLDRLGLPPGPAAGTSALAAAPFLLPPALLLGTLVPLLVRLRSGPAGEGRWSGWVYGAGTLGSALGPLAGVALLATVGETQGLLVAGGSAVAAGLLLLGSDRRIPSPSPPLPSAPSSRPLRSAGALAFVVGFALLLAEVAWLRLLGPLAGSTVVGTATLLASVLLANAVGAGIGAATLRHGSPLPLVLLLAVGGVAAAASLPTAGLAPWLLLGPGDGGPGARVAALALAVFSTVAPTALLLGAAFPRIVRAAGAAGSAPGVATGEILGWSGAGGALGGLAAAFVLLPRFGAPGVLLLATATVSVAAGVWWLHAGGRGRAVGSLALVLPVVAIAVPALQRPLLASVPTPAEAAAAAEPTRAGIRLSTPDDVALYAELFYGTLLDAREGRAATLALLAERGAGIRLRVGEKPEGRYDPSEPQRPPVPEAGLGLLAAALHAAPHRALVVGHGLGWTAEALLDAGIGSVDVAEIDAAVLDLAGTLRGEPLAVRRDPRARTILADGRRVMRRAAREPASERYDLLVVQPSRPWAATAAPLFTEEAWREARSALAPGGLIAQWIDLSPQASESLQATLAAFHTVFPDAWGFRFDGDLVLVGFTRPPRLDPERFDRVVASNRAAGAFRDGPDLFKHFAFDAAGFAGMLDATATPATDDRPPLATDLGLARLLGRTAAAADPVDAAFPPAVHAALPEATARERWCREATEAWLRQGRPDLALRWATRVPWGQGPDAKRVRGSVQFAVGDAARAEEFFRAATEEAPDRPDLLAEWLRHLGVLAREGRLPEGTLARGAQAAERFPDDGRVLAALGRMWADALFYEPGRDAYRRAVRATGAPAPPGTGVFLARMLVASGEGEDAEILEILRADPACAEDPDALQLLWQIETRIGTRADAERLGAALVDLQTRQGEARLRAAERALREGRLQAAAEAAATALALRPEDPDAWEERALALLAWRRLPGLPHASRAEAEQEAAFALAEAARRRPDPEAGRARGRAILRWHGLPEENLPAEKPESP